MREVPISGQDARQTLDIKLAWGTLLQRDMKTIIEHITDLADDLNIMARELREASVLPPEEAIRVLLGQENPRNSTKNEKNSTPI